MTGDGTTLRLPAADWAVLAEVTFEAADDLRALAAHEPVGQPQLLRVRRDLVARAERLEGLAERMREASVSVAPDSQVPRRSESAADDQRRARQERETAVDDSVTADLMAEHRLVTPPIPGPPDSL